MYYKLIERKSGVPANEKARARTEYYNELRKAERGSARSRRTRWPIRKNFMLALSTMIDRFNHKLDKDTDQKLVEDVDD